MYKIFLIVMLLTSCNVAKKDSSQSFQIKDEKNEDPCAYRNERKTIGIISDTGVIIKFYNDYLIRSDNGGRYAPCNLPVNFHQEGLKIKFTAEEKEIYPYEKTIGGLITLLDYTVEK